jgi:hypothetical protein
MTTQDLESTRKKVISSLKVIRSRNPMLARKLLGVRAKDFIKVFEKAPIEESKTAQTIESLACLLNIPTAEIEEEVA